MAHKHSILLWLRSTAKPKLLVVIMLQLTVPLKRMVDW
jgi:hypothetical protein